MMKNHETIEFLMLPEVADGFWAEASPTQFGRHPPQVKDPGIAGTLCTLTAWNRAIGSTESAALQVAMIRK